MNKTATILRLCLMAATTWLLAGCITEDGFDNTPSGNFEALWRTLDEHYCFFPEKAAAHQLDWNEVHERYRQKIVPTMNSEQLFEVCSHMLRELRDGHVNLTSSFNVSRYWDWFENYPANFSDSLLRRYLGKDYAISAGLRYRILDDNIGYIYCGSFDHAYGSGNLNAVFTKLAMCNGLIVDIRNNEGGMLSEAQNLAGCFTNEEITGGYMAHKTGPAHDAISKPEPLKVKPAEGIRWQRKTVVLTNRSTYSAANTFAMYMRACKNVTLMGTPTGGGGGMPFHSELPNGWSVRFSACPMFDKDMNCVEEGIEPDLRVELTEEDFRQGFDTMIEAARAYLKTGEKP